MTSARRERPELSEPRGRCPRRRPSAARTKMRVSAAPGPPARGLGGTESRGDPPGTPARGEGTGGFGGEPLSPQGAGRAAGAAGAVPPQDRGAERAHRGTRSPESRGAVRAAPQRGLYKQSDATGKEFKRLDGKSGVRFQLKPWV